MSDKNETIGQMKQRHKLELRNLQNQIKEFQKKAKKDRMDKKEIELKSKQMEEDIQKRHEEEMNTLKEDEDEEDYTAIATVSVSVSVPPVPPVPPVEEKQKKPQGPTKAQRRREKKKQQEKERQQEIEEANKNFVSDRQVESTLIQAKLSLFKLAIKDIPSDGHCMYHAVADQMISHGVSLPSSSSSSPDFQKLRQLTSKYMLNHPDDFMPFLALDLDSELYAAYCDRVANSSDWGGQLELRALAMALQVPIHVFSAEGDVIRMGEEFNNTHEPLHLTYHLHYYTLGEHFNSVKPLEAVSKSME